jgi:eukaryotic-like serine/threonine-protein kinase
MNVDDHGATEDEYIARLAALDDALRSRRPTNVLDESGSLLPLERRRLEQNGAWCEFVRAAWTSESDSPAPEESRAPLDGNTPRRFGRYEVRHELGRGSYGVVFLADDPRLRRQVALKLPRPEVLVTAEMRRRFEREAHAAAVLDHPNVVPVFDAGEEGSIIFIASAYCPGPTLAAWLKEREEPVPPRKAALIMLALARAIAHAHGRGVLHRDLKPGNIVLEPLPDGAPATPDRDALSFTPRVTDFGLARLTATGPGAAAATQTGEVIGTPSYMSPEQAVGAGGAVGPATDVYGLGAILYALLTGRPPFQADSAIDTLVVLRTQEPIAPSRLRLRLPRALETICLKCLHKAPQGRYASAEALAEDLDRFLAGRPVVARRVGALEQFQRWCIRNPLLATVSVTAALLTVVLAVGSTIAALTFRDQRNRLETEQGKTSANLVRALNAEHTANDRLEQTQKAERQARLELGKSLQAEGAALERTGLVGQRFASLHRLKAAASVFREHPDGRARLAELRDQAITAMGLTDLRPLWQRDTGAVMSITCDRALKRYAIIEPAAKPEVGGQTVVRSLDDDRELFRIPRPEIWFRSAFAAFSPDGQYLAVGGGGVYFDVWHVERRERIFHQPTRTEAHAFLPDGRRLVFGPLEKDLVVWDLVDRQEVKRLPLGFPPKSLCLDPPGRRIAANAREPAPCEVRIIDLETGQQLTNWTENVGDYPMSWSADGRLLAIGYGSGRSFVWDVERGRLASVLATGAAASEFAPFGSMLATTNAEGMRLWDAAQGESLVHAPLCTPRGFSPDGRRLAFHDGSHLGIWEVAHDQELITLHLGLVGNRAETIGQAAVRAAGFSPDGRLAAVSTDEAVYLHDGHTGRDLAQLKAKSCWSVLFDRDVRNLITYGEQGLFRWPIGDDPAGGIGALRIGPPVLVRETTSDAGFKASWLPDGRTLAILETTSARISLVDTNAPFPARKRVESLSTLSGSRMLSVAVSLDGRWAAAGDANDVGIYVWDLPGRRLERTLSAGDSLADSQTVARFSPDGRWLVSSSNVAPACGYYFWEVGTWKRGPFIARSISPTWPEPVFSPDGQVIALSVSNQQIRLAEAATGRTLAHLTTLEPRGAIPFAFSPDGTRLIVSAGVTALMWDLRRIRDRLRTMDLDWDQPPYRPEDDSPGAALPSIRSIRLIGEALEPVARRAAELAAVDAKLRDHPDDPDARFERGWLKLRMAKASEAIADLKRGLSLRPDDGDAPFLLAEACTQAGNPAAAKATLEKYLARSPSDIDARAMHGQAALQLGRLQEAADEFTKVLDADPRRDSVRSRRAQTWLRLGRSQEALADVDELIQNYPKDPTLYELRSQVNDRLGHPERALADLKKAVESPVGGAHHANNLAWRLATGPVVLRDPKQALVMARKAVGLTPGESVYLNTLGVAQYRAGLYSEAIATLEQSFGAAKGASEPFDLFFLAMARCKLGQFTLARANFDQAVEWRRSHPKGTTPGWSDELHEFQAEAKALLNAVSSELPDDVFGSDPSSQP